MKAKTWYKAAAACGILFLLLIILVRTADVSAAGPAGTSVGLSRLNAAVHGATGVHFGLYTFTEILGLLAIAVAAVFALFGLAQLIRRKSLFKVDRDILLLGGLYLAVVLFYMIFEVIVINVRPVVMPGDTAPEASFPSSHTMLVCTVMGSAIMLLRRKKEGRFLYLPALPASVRRALPAACAAVAAVTVTGRLVSGAHWFTDILGGLLLSGALLALFAGMLADRRVLRGRARG